VAVADHTQLKVREERQAREVVEPEVQDHRQRPQQDRPTPEAVVAEIQEIIQAVVAALAS